MLVPKVIPARPFEFALNAGMTKDTVDYTSVNHVGAMTVGRTNGAKAAESHNDRMYSSGAVGSSINHGLISASLFTY